MKKLVAVFGPAGCAAGDPLYESAETCGRLLGEAGFAVVTGGYEGVMEAASKGARAAGASAIGVTAEVYYARGREANGFLTREVRLKSAADRLMELLDLPDAYIAIGNSTGSLAEVAMVWDYMVKGFLPKKPFLLVGESWRSFLGAIEKEDLLQPHLALLQYHAKCETAVGHLQGLIGSSILLPDLQIIQPTQ